VFLRFAAEAPLNRIGMVRVNDDLLGTPPREMIDDVMMRDLRLRCSVFGEEKRLREGDSFRINLLFDDPGL
jgi:hypothetical protein